MTQRTGHVWTADKLDFLEKYLPAFQLVCKRLWNENNCGTVYVDGFAGPGRNSIDEKVRDGSPLIAIKQKHKFDKYFLCEKDRRNFENLKSEIENLNSDLDIRMIQGDFNLHVSSILQQIEYWRPTFFFLDPEGLELEWETVRKIGSRKKADLFILISGSGVLRASGSNLSEAHYETVTRFYGNEGWRDRLDKTPATIDTHIGKRRFELALDLYLEGLRNLGFTTVERYLLAKNSRNADLHALVFASKNSTANRIADDVIKSIQQGQQISLF